jgi:hypothetical protein
MAMLRFSAMRSFYFPEGMAQQVGSVGMIRPARLLVLEKAHSVLPSRGVELACGGPLRRPV